MFSEIDQEFFLALLTLFTSVIALGVVYKGLKDLIDTAGFVFAEIFNALPLWFRALFFGLLALLLFRLGS